MKACVALAVGLVIGTVFADCPNAKIERAKVEFSRARFGLFLHWGLYSQLGGRWKGQVMPYIGEWTQSKFRIPNSEYAALAKEFNPTKFDADEWARLAAEAGMKYVVLTAKHHEGFAMFKSFASDFNIVDATPFKRDVFAELAAACRKYDLKVCFYYSQCLDWHEKDAADDPSTRGGNFGMDWGNSWDWPDASEKDLRRYLKAKVYPQLRELLTNYGDVFYIWFDCPFGMDKEETRELREFVRSLQPDTLVSSRIGKGFGDVGSLGDNQEVAGKVVSLAESPMTINDTWGFKWDDHNWKSGYDIACMVARSSSRNSNVLLNIGPRPDGTLPEASCDVLRELAAWRKKTGYEIYASGAGPFPQDFPWGWCTQAEDGTLQFVVKKSWTENLEIGGIRNRVRTCSHAYVQEGELLTVTLPPPDDAMPRVVRLKLEGAPDILSDLMPQNGVLTLAPATGKLVPGSQSTAGGVVTGAAGEKFDGRVCKFGESGSLVGWHHAGDTISWKVRFPKDGKYRVFLRTESFAHSKPWCDDRVVRVTLGGTSHEVRMKNDRKVPHTVYARADSDCGVFETVRGEAELVITTVSSGTTAYPHCLTAVLLEKEQEVR